MQRVKIILAAALICILTGGGIIFGMLMNASAETEKKYQNTINEIEKGDWNSAFKTVEGIPHYKNASALYAFIYPHILFYSSYNNDNEAIAGYSQALSYIGEHKNEFADAQNSKYGNQIGELEKTLSFKVSELKAKSDSNSETSGLADAVNLIKSGNYTQAQVKLASINSADANAEKQQLLEYINLLNVIKNHNAKDKNNKDIYSAIAKLDPNYTGDMSNEIKTSVQAYADSDRWNALYKPDNSVNTATISVAVGDRRENVLQNLGKPVKQNMISNSYGIFEEMVFSSNKYIYLENNIVTVIKYQAL